jgi:hypothetical protein
MAQQIVGTLNRKGQLRRAKQLRLDPSFEFVNHRKLLTPAAAAEAA